MRKQTENTTIAVRYINLYSNSIMAWGPIVRFVESFGFTAIPEYESRVIRGLLTEHDIEVHTNRYNVKELMPMIQQRYGNFPCIQSIYIRDEEGT